MIRSTLIVLCLLFFHSVKAEYNFAPFTIVKSSPYIGSSLKYLTDKRLGEDDNTFAIDAPLPIKLGQAIKVDFHFIFPAPFSISKIRIYQFKVESRRWAKEFVISADLDGDNICETPLKEERNGKADKWMEFTFSAQPVAYQLCFNTMKLSDEKGPNYGGPIIGEFEIYTLDDDGLNLPVNLSNQQISNTATLLVENSTSSNLLDTFAITKKPWNEQFGRGVFASMWYFWEPGHNYESQKQQFKLNKLKELGVNRLWLYSGSYSKPDTPFLTSPANKLSQFFVNRKNKNKEKIKVLPFPSDVSVGYQSNILSDFSSDLNLNNIGLIANEMLLPYGKVGWDFPRVNNVREYPSLCSKFIREQSTKLYQELMASGVNALALGGDEFFIYQGVDYKTTEADICFVNGIKKQACKPECRDLFYQTYHVYPDKALVRNFSELTAKWKIFQYRQVAEWFSKYNEMMKLKNPQAISTSLFRSAEQNRIGYGIAYDILGADGTIDELSSDPYWTGNSYLGHFIFSNETKKLIGANANRKATVTLQTTPYFKPKGFKNPLMVSGPAFASIMHGINGLNFYKFDYLNVLTPLSAAPTVKNIFTFTQYLESINLNDFSIAKDVALLYSRASEDWWQLRYAKEENTSLLAHLTQNAVMEVLFKESVPFDLFYLDQPSLLNNLEQYKLLILPFPYSLSMETYYLLEQLSDNGAQILTINKKGEVNEFGVKYARPLLKDTEKFDALKLDLVNTNYKEVSSKIMSVIENKLGPNASLSVDASDYDIECTVHKNKIKNEQLLFCLNWEDKGYQAVLSLNVPNGSYKIDKIDLVSITKMKNNDGNYTFDANDLNYFKLNINKGDTFVLWIQSI